MGSTSSSVKPPLIEFLSQPAEGDMMTLMQLELNMQLRWCHCGGKMIGGWHKSITISINWLYNQELMSLCILWAVDVCQIAVTSASEQGRHDCCRKTSCVWSSSSKQMAKKAYTHFLSPICLSQPQSVCAFMCVY